MQVSSATILTFPTRAARPTEAAPARPGAGIEALNEALTAQRAALRDWRYSIAELQVAVASLGCSLQLYQANLGALAGEVAMLGGKARRLHARFA